MQKKNIKILYGYHESGHYSVAHAIRHAVDRLGAKTSMSKLFEGECRNWTTLFETFRSVNSQGSLNFPNFFASDDVLQSISEAVRHRSLEIDAEVIVSTHPYTSYALAESIPHGKTLIYDVHTNYTPGPIFPHPRIDGYFTPISRPELPFYFRSRTVECKIPLTQDRRPTTEQKVEKNHWLFALGADGWGDHSDLHRIAKILPCNTKLYVLAGRNYKDVSAAVSPTLRNVSVVPYKSDISEYLRQSKFVFSKAGGSTVTESIAHRCVPVFVRSYVPWELQAARHLVEAGVGIYLDDLIWMVGQSGASEVWKHYVDRSENFRSQILSAADWIATALVNGLSEPPTKLLVNPDIPMPGEDPLGQLLKKKIQRWKSAVT